MAKQYDLSIKIKTLRGQEVPVFFATPEQRQEAIGSDKKLDTSKLPRETAQDIILTALELYPVNDRKGTFLIYNLGQAIVTDSKPELSKMQIDFLSKVLEWATIHEEEAKDGSLESKGIYPAWKIAQVLTALGITE